MAAQPSLTRIVNRAAVWLGTSQRIDSMEDDKPLATAAAAVIDYARDELLASHPWKFATAFRQCAAVPVEPLERGNYARAFERPGDMLRYLPARPDDGWGAPDVVEMGDWFLSDAEAPLVVRCIVRIENPSKWSPAFNAALAAQLAFEIAAQVTGSDTLDTKLVNRLNAAITKAKRQDGQANGRRERMDSRLSSWVASRDVPGRDGQYGPPIV